jgi:hypothetical protein
LPSRDNDELISERRAENTSAALREVEAETASLDQATLFIIDPISICILIKIMNIINFM